MMTTHAVEYMLAVPACHTHDVVLIIEVNNTSTAFGRCELGSHKLTCSDAAASSPCYVCPCTLSVGKQSEGLQTILRGTESSWCKHAAG